MPNGNQYGIPPDASPVEVAGYFSSVDPDFAKASNEDKAAYMSHVTGRQIQYVGGSPIDMESGQGALGASRAEARRGIPQPKRIPTLQDYANAQPINELTGVPETPEQAARDALTTGATLASTVLPATEVAEGISTGTLVPKLATLGRTTLGSALGTAGGRYIGREAGGVFGPIGSQIGGTIGGIGGGFLGGAMGYKGLRLPGRFGEVGELLAPPDPLAKQKELGEFMARGYKPVDDAAVTQAIREGRAARVPMRISASETQAELGSPENPGFFAKIPTRMPRLPEPEPELGTPENPGLLSKIPTGRRSLPPNPQEGLGEFMNQGYRPMVGPGPEDMPASEAQRAAFQNRGYRSSADISQREAAALPPVVQVPEPRPGTPLTREGAMWSIKRGKLLPLAQSGQPGAVDVLQNLGVRPIIIPRGAGIEAPSISSIREPLLLPERPTSVLPRIGEGTSAVNLVEGEAPRTNPSQEMMSLAHDESRLRSILSDPRASAEEKAYARRVLGAP